MSYDIYLKGEGGEKVQVRPFLGGGTIQVNPETMEEVPQVEAYLNVTWNYGHVYDLAIKGAKLDLLTDVAQVKQSREHQTIALIDVMVRDGLVRAIDGKRARDVQDALELVLANLGNTRPYEDYWAPTLGNAAVPLRTLVSWCYEAPDATFAAR